jgi:hypothetical protein
MIYRAAAAQEFWHKADIGWCTANVRFWGGNADIIQGKADIKKCPKRTYACRECWQSAEKSMPAQVPDARTA